MLRNDKQVVGILKSPSGRRDLQQKLGSPRLKELNHQGQSSFNLKKRFIHRGNGNGQTKPWLSLIMSSGQAQGCTETLLQAILDASPANLAVLDESGTILQVNRAWCRYADHYSFLADPYGLGLDYVNAWQEVFGSADETNGVAEGIQQILAGTETVFHKQYYCASPTAPRWILLRAARFDLPGSGGAFRILVTHEDITSNIQEIEVMPDGDKHLRNVLDHIFAFVAVLTPDGTLIEVNRAPLEAAGITLNEVDGKKFWDCSWWNYDARVQARLRKACERVAGGETRRCDVTVRMADARMLSVDFMLAPLKDDEGKVTHLIASAVDITKHKSMEEALQDLSGRLIGVQEAERQRIARELHDDLNQRMAILSIELQQLDQSIPKRKTSLHTSIQNLWAKAQEISAEIHRLSYQLHPFKLDHLGLMAAVKDFCDELSRRKDLKIEFRHQGFPAVLPQDIRLCLFRIVQESLHNVVKHSGARAALVVLEKTDQAVNLSVSDKGCGFNAESAWIKGGLGLISMRERLRLVGGEIIIHSQPSRGTQVNVSIPLTRQDGAVSEESEVL